jgi:serine/threonine-protein kinase RsbW
MSSDSVRLSLPARPDFARSVRMLASTLAVSSSFSVDDVEDVRMAAEEGFVYACASGIESCDISFVLTEDAVTMEFVLGDGAQQDSDPADVETDLDMVELLLDAVCEEFSVLETRDGAVLHLVKRASHGR